MSKVLAQQPSIQSGKLDNYRFWISIFNYRTIRDFNEEGYASTGIKLL